MTTRITVKVHEPIKRTTKSEKTMYFQDIQLERPKGRPVFITRRYMDQDKVLAAGDYTCQLSFYEVKSKNSAGYEETHVCISPTDFQPLA